MTVREFGPPRCADYMQNREWLQARRRDLVARIGRDPHPDRGRRSGRLDALLIINHALAQLELQRVA